MEYRWFAVQVASNQERSVKESLEKAIMLDKLEALIPEIFVPLVPSKGGTKKMDTTIPGYVFLKIAMVDETEADLEAESESSAKKKSAQKAEKSLDGGVVPAARKRLAFAAQDLIVKNSKVIRFLQMDKKSHIPLPLDEDQIAIFMADVQEKKDRPTQQFAIGEYVIAPGVFGETTRGIVVGYDQATRHVHARFTLFGRDTLLHKPAADFTRAADQDQG